MSEPFFSDIQINRVELSTGAHIGLPFRCRDWSAMIAHFPASASCVRRILPTGKFKPALIVPGVAVVSMAAIEYRSMADVGPYNEFGVMVPVLYEPAVNLPSLPLLFPDRFKRFGLYVYRLPVTTQESVDVGVEVWGYPKMVGDIDFEDAGDMRLCQLRIEGKDVITLKVKKISTRRRRISFYSFTLKEGRIMRTLFEAQGDCGMSIFTGGASYALGDHPMAEEIRALGIGKRALGCIYAPRMQGIVHPPGEVSSL